MQVIGLRLEQPHRRGELIEALRDAKAFAEQTGATGAIAAALTDAGERAGNIAYVVEFEHFAALRRNRIALAKAIEGGSPRRSPRCCGPRTARCGSRNGTFARRSTRVRNP